MENRNPQPDQGLPRGDSKLRIYSAANRKGTGRQGGRTTTEPGAPRLVTPRIELQLIDDRDVYQPGDVLVCEYSLQLPDDVQVSAVESSVIWFTDGKGDEDMGVHFFERRKKSSLLPKQLAEKHRLGTVLPKSPLSYEGAIVQVRWCVRIRVFLATGKQFTEDVLFQLGETVAIEELADQTEPSDEISDDDNK